MAAKQDSSPIVLKKNIRTKFFLDNLGHVHAYLNSIADLYWDSIYL